MARHIISSIFRIVWPLFFSVFGVREYWLGKNQICLSNHNTQVFCIVIVISVLWLIIMIRHETPVLRDIFSHLRPIIKFVVTKHSESPTFKIQNGCRILSGISVNIDGYFENSGSLHGTVEWIKISLVKRILSRYMRVGGIKCGEVCFGAIGDNGVITDEMGYYVKGDSKSPTILGTGSCEVKQKFPISKLGRNHAILLSWKVFGQDKRQLALLPDWDVFRKDYQNAISRPILGEEGLEI